MNGGYFEINYAFLLFSQWLSIIAKQSSVPGNLMFIAIASDNVNLYGHQHTRQDNSIKKDILLYSK